MWKCGKCGEEQEETLESCWKCGELKPKESVRPTSSPPEAKRTSSQKSYKSIKTEPVKGTVLKHWYALIPDFKTSAQAFYSDIESELEQRNVPDLEMGRVEFSQGGILSGKREYLRMKRERLVFDICSAPFGTAHFFSCRFIELPSVITLNQILGIVFSLCVIFGVAQQSLGMRNAGYVTGGFVAFFILMMQGAAAMKQQNIDAQLIKSPLLGPIYERFFRRETYFREDTRLMYMDTVNEVAKEKIEEVLGSKGLKLVRFNDRKSVLSELYTARIVELSASEPEKAA